MQYRHLGRSGLQVSLLSFGSWVTFGNQVDRGLAAECLRIAHDAGVNFFDNAEVYSRGESERIMGQAIADLGWKRHEYVISTKFFWGIHDAVNMRNTLNRKYLMHAIDGSLERLGLDFVDLVFCHRPDFETPVEETVWAMHDIIDRGKAHYWGTSEWPAERILAAHRFATDNHLHAPVMEQPQYNLLARQRVEEEYAPLYEELGLGLTIWSPLASGVLTGKYLDGVPEGSRAALRGYEWLRSSMLTEENLNRVRRLKAIADRLGVALTHLSLAWCARNPNVSTVITGASRPEQVSDNMQALDVLPLLTDEVMREIDAAVA
ncbi:MAG TPA: aldo/keto reductase [Candidatus Angelobacter sp.]|nr:aldo/keto reductase [Candidatus Angelobacter sp.]